MNPSEIKEIMDVTGSLVEALIGRSAQEKKETVKVDSSLPTPKTDSPTGTLIEQSSQQKEAMNLKRAEEITTQIRERIDRRKLCHGQCNNTSTIDRCRIHSVPFLVVGMKVHHYIGEFLDGHNCNFKEYKEPMEEYIICMSKDDKKYELSLKEVNGQCYSGWSTATWGESIIKEVVNFGAITHVPKKDINKVINLSNCHDSPTEYFKTGEVYECDFFYFNIDGGDDYYPSGSAYAKLDAFEATNRGFDKTPVWVFKGDSNLGKSFLAHKLKDMKIYETDCSDVLPELLGYNVIVLGNKHNFTLEEIKGKLPGIKVMTVSFEE